MPQPTPRECIKGPGQQGGVELNLVLVQALACKVYIMNNRLQSLPMQGRDAQHKHRVWTTHTGSWRTANKQHDHGAL